MCWAKMSFYFCGFNCSFSRLCKLHSQMLLFLSRAMRSQYETSLMNVLKAACGVVTRSRGVVEAPFNTCPANPLLPADKLLDPSAQLPTRPSFVTSSCASQLFLCLIWTSCFPHGQLFQLPYATLGLWRSWRSCLRSTLPPCYSLHHTGVSGSSIKLFQIHFLR